VAASPSPGSRSPLRMAGIALLGIGVIAAFAGLITTTQGSGNGGGNAAQAPTSSSAVLYPNGEAAVPSPPAVASPPPGAATPAPQATPFVPGATGDGTAAAAEPPARPAPVAPAQQPPAVAAPAPADGGAGGGGATGGGAATTHEPLRVYNNSLIKGLAAQAAADLRDAGYTVTEIGGYPGATIATSTVYFRPGTAEEAAAQQLGRAFGFRVEPRFSGIQSASPGVIVIVTKEYRSPGKS
jgi:LytR cell envelope-related transcriptional attenuator